jgi:protease-4
MLTRALSVGVVLVCGLAAGVASAQGPGARLAWFNIENSLADRPNELAWLMGSQNSPTLRETVNAIGDAARDERYRGIVLRMKDATLSTSQVYELGEAIRDAREAGKKVHVFAESMGTAELMLGSFADEVIGQTGGGVSFPGLYMEEIFLADLLQWGGLKADMVQVGDYKGASEQMARNSPSPQWDENINFLLDGMYDAVRAPMLAGRGMDGSQLDSAMETLWFADMQTAADAGLVDSVVDLASLTEHLAGGYGAEVSVQTVKPGSKGQMDPATASPFAMFSLFSREPDHKPKRDTVAVLHINGQIIDGDSGASFMGGSTVGSRTVRNAIEDIMREKRVRAVVVRIDSPGGSATASEVMWQGLRRLAATRPVWVSVGGMAASGGYYCAVGGSRIVLTPASIVGSIGVVGGKVSMNGLYEKLNINVVERARGPRAAMFSSVASWSDRERDMVRQTMTQTYDLFTSRVLAGRPGLDLDKAAEGRLFVGLQAVNVGLADELGTLDDTIKGLAEHVGLREYDVMDYPGPRSLSAVLEDAFKGFVNAPVGGVQQAAGPAIASGFASTLGAEVMGEAAWVQVRDQLSALMALRDQRIMLVSPRAIIWR